jgi:hypothetical protein
MREGYILSANVSRIGRVPKAGELQNSDQTLEVGFVLLDPDKFAILEKTLPTFIPSHD